jgi:hypothetical protein
MTNDKIYPEYSELTLGFWISCLPAGRDLALVRQLAD